MATIPAYDIGDKIRIGNHVGTNLDGNARDAFKDSAGVVTDPDTITLRLRKLPSGTTKVFGYPSGVDGVLIKESSGRYYTDYIAVSGDDGRWGWRLEGTGLVQTADEGEFRIAASAIV
jgi:hypothetical protein